MSSSIDVRRGAYFNGASTLSVMRSDNREHAHRNIEPTALPVAKCRRTSLGFHTTYRCLKHRD